MPHQEQQATAHRAILKPSSDDTGSIPWRQRPGITIQTAAEVAGCSTAQIYARARRGEIVLKTLFGKTIVDVPSFAKVVDGAAPWTPSNRGQAAVAARKKATAA